jgi:hypothetical protein
MAENEFRILNYQLAGAMALPLSVVVLALSTSTFTKSPLL